MITEKLTFNIDVSQVANGIKREEQKSGGESPTKSPLRRKKLIVLREDEDPYVIELEERIQEQDRELAKRNESIFSIQRNFESISQISRSLKQENEQIKLDNQKYKQKSDRYDEMEIGIQKQVKEYRDIISGLKENIHSLQVEDKQNKKHLQELLKFRNKCTDLEKEIQILSVKNKEQEYQINDLSILVKSSEKLVVEIKSLKQTITDHQQNIKQNQTTMKKQQNEVSTLQAKLTEQEQSMKKQQLIIDELSESKNYLCSLEAKNTQMHTKERKKIEELQEQIQKLEERLSNQSALLYIKSAKQEEKECKLRQSQALFHAKEEEIEQLQKLKIENEELKVYCICKKFPKLFAECEKLFNQLSSDEKDDFQFSYEDQYSLVLKEDYDKMNHLFKILTQNLSNYKRSFMQLNERPSQLEFEFKSEQEQVEHLQKALKESQLEKHSLIEMIKKISSQNNQRDSQKILRDALNGNLNGVIKAQDQEILFLKGKVQKYHNEVRALQVNMKAQKNQIEELEDSLQITELVLKNNQQNKQTLNLISTFLQNCSLVESLLQNSKKIEESIVEYFSSPPQSQQIQ